MTTDLREGEDGLPVLDANPFADDAPETPEQAQPEPKQAEPQPEAPQPAAEPAADAGKPPPGYVPIQALHEERTKRQELQSKLGTLEEKFGQLEARLKPAEPAKPDDPEPKYDDDPLGWHQWQARQQGKEIESLKSFTQAEEQRRQAMAEAEADLDFLRSSVEQTLAEIPDYGDAAQHLVAQRRAEMAALGFTDPRRQEGVLTSELIAITRAAKKDGVNPAQRIYALAKARGYAPKGVEVETKGETEAEAAEAAQEAIDEAGGQPAAAKAAPKPRARSLSQAGAMPARGNGAAALDTDDFDAKIEAMASIDLERNPSKARAFFGA